MTGCERNRPVSLRLSVTDRCHLRCRYCMPAHGISKRPQKEILSFEEILSFVQVVGRYYRISKIHVTGGDPLARAGIVDFIGMLKEEVATDLALTTNGQELTDLASRLRNAGLSRVNISLDTLNAETFRDLTRGGDLSRTLDGIRTALAQGFSPVKLNVVVMRNINHREVVDIARFGIGIGCHVRFLELMPVRSAATEFSRLFVSAQEVRDRLLNEFDLRPLPTPKGASSRDVIARDRNGKEGIIGFISPYSRPFCDGCARLRLTSTGQLVGCLARGEGPNIRDLLRNQPDSPESQIMDAVAAALSLKRSIHAYRPATQDQPWSAEHAAMACIGG